jgi:hypothetical protein
MEKSFRPQIKKVVLFNKFKKQSINLINKSNILRKNWSIREDLHLLQKYLYFKRKWSLIAKEFEGRNQHTIKNRFFSLLGKESKLARRTLQKNLKNLDEYGLILNTIRSLNEALEQEEDKQIKLMIREECSNSTRSEKSCDDDYEQNTTQII